MVTSLRVIWRTWLAVFVSVLLVPFSACTVDGSQSGGKPDQDSLAAHVEVVEGRDATARSEDGSLTVELPSESFEGSGELRIVPAVADGVEGWTVELEGAELTGEATLSFSMPGLALGEPPPLVRWAPAIDRRLRIADATVEGDRMVVRTSHFSFWSAISWSRLREEVLAWIGQQLDAMSALAGASDPTCADEEVVRTDGYSVSSDSGRRALWCMGKENGQPVLKVVNGRGYGVAAEYSPGLTFKSMDDKDLVATLANLIPSPPITRGNSVALLPSTNEIQFTASGVPASTVMLSPDAGAYLLSALLFGLDTYAMVATKVAGTAAKETKGLMLTSLQAQSCVNSFSSMATSDIDTPGKARKFFADALGVSFSCLTDAAKQAHFSGPLAVVIEGVIWLMSGVETLVNGLVGALESFDMDGYRVIVHGPTTPPTEKVVVNPFTSTGLAPGWTVGEGSDGVVLDCVFDEGSPHAVGKSTHWCGSVADSANACWSAQSNTAQLWCLNTFDMSDRTLRTYDAVNVDDDTPAPSDPEPLWLELEDGSQYWYRTGGSWGGRADDLRGAYGCLNEVGLCATGEGNVILTPYDTPPIDTTQPAWRVRVGPLGGPDEQFPPPEWVDVTRAWFIAGHRWQGD
ncbi:MAG: hypothetical protein V9G04_07805 [Nocardioides sp.]